MPDVRLPAAPVLGRTDDPAEAEADRAADRVTRSGAVTGPVGRPLTGRAVEPRASLVTGERGYRGRAGTGPAAGCPNNGFLRTAVRGSP